MSNSASVKLRERILNRSARIGVVGLGYVGLPLAAGFAARGFRVIGVDLDEGKVRTLNEGQSTIQDIDGAEIAAMIGKRRKGHRFEREIAEHLRKRAAGQFN